MVEPKPDPDDARSELASVMAKTAEVLRNQLGAIRAAYDHSGLKGEGGEAVVAEFLKERLPDSVGVTTGQVMDATGTRSKQTDVVLYDALRTPMLFETPGGRHHLVPAEGALGVIEVKTRLTKAELPGCLANCHSVKRLRRTAYFDQPIRYAYRVYDREWDDPPIFFSVFAGSSDNMYAGPLNELHEDLPLHERIDTVCSLDRGVNLNVDLTMESVLGRTAVTATASGRTALMDIPSDDALLLWYGSLAGMVMQANVRPINITAYMTSELHVSGTMPDNRLIDALKVQMSATMAEDQGLDPGSLVRWMQKRLTPKDVYDILRAPGFQVDPNASAEARAGAKAAMEAARSMTFDEWVAMGMPGFEPH